MFGHSPVEDAWVASSCSCCVSVLSRETESARMYTKKGERELMKETGSGDCGNWEVPLTWARWDDGLEATLPPLM